MNEVKYVKHMQEMIAQQEQIVAHLEHQRDAYTSLATDTAQHLASFRASLAAEIGESSKIIEGLER